MVMRKDGGCGGLGDAALPLAPGRLLGSRGGDSGIGGGLIDAAELGLRGETLWEPRRTMRLFAAFAFLAVSFGFLKERVDSRSARSVATREDRFREFKEK